MDPILQLSLFAGLLGALPCLLLFVYRKTIPPGVLWAVIACQFVFPVFGWAVALWVALKEWPEESA